MPPVPSPSPSPPRRHRHPEQRIHLHRRDHLALAGGRSVDRRNCGLRLQRDPLRIRRHSPLFLCRHSRRTPGGLSLNASSGAITGTPTTAGTASFTVTATDANSNSGSAAYSITVNSGPPTTSPVSANVPANTANNVIALAIGGAATSVAVSSPPTHGTAAASGITIVYTPAPGFSGRDSFTYTASNAGGTSAPAQITVTVTAPTIAIAPTALPAGAGGAAYGPVTLTASGGTAPYTFALSQGALPAGLTLAANGTLSGTPTATGSFAFTVTATDASSFSGSQAFTLAVTAPVPVAQNKQAELLAGTSATVDLTAGASGGPFVSAAVTTPPPAADGTATITQSNGSYSLVYASSAGAAGTVVVAFTLSNKWGASAPATVTFTVTPRPDPTQDPEVIGLMNAQVQSAQALGMAQIRNFNDRLERLHDEKARRAGAMNIRIGAPSQPQPAPDTLNFGEIAEGTNAAEGAIARRPIGSAARPEAMQDEPDDGPLSFWSGGFVNFGTNDNNKVDISQTMIGVTTGVDMELVKGFIAGVGVGYGRNAADIGSNGTSNIGQAFSTALYGSYHPARTSSSTVFSATAIWISTATAM